MAKKQKICVGGFIIKDDKFLFGKRSVEKSWAPGLWDIIGGHAHKHEDLYDALSREAFEETGIAIQCAELICVTDVFDKSKNHIFKYYIYVITSYTGEPANCSDEHTEMEWFTRDELNELSLALPIYTTLIDEWINLRMQKTGR